jgi:hypothetical protein
MNQATSFYRSFTSPLSPRERNLSLSFPTLLLPLPTLALLALALTLTLPLPIHNGRRRTRNTLLNRRRINHLHITRRATNPRQSQTRDIRTSRQLAQTRNQPANLGDLVRLVLQDDARGGIIGFEGESGDGAGSLGLC